MVNVSSIEVKTYTIQMSEEEAIWLKGLVQNFLNVDGLSVESPDDAKTRQMFWDALHEVQVR